MFDNWKFKRETPQPISAGPHRLRIYSAEAAVSKNGNDMLVVQFEVSGDARLIYHYIVFLPDRPEITNRNLTNFFDSFGIEDGDFNLQTWKGKVGAGIIYQDDSGYAKIKRFMNAQQQEDLPPWEQVGDRQPAPFAEQKTPDDELPF